MSRTAGRLEEGNGFVEIRRQRESPLHEERLPRAMSTSANYGIFPCRIMCPFAFSSSIVQSRSYAGIGADIDNPGGPDRARFKNTRHVVGASGYTSAIARPHDQLTRIWQLYGRRDRGQII